MELFVHGVQQVYFLGEPQVYLVRYLSKLFTFKLLKYFKVWLIIAHLYSYFILLFFFLFSVHRCWHGQLKYHDMIVIQSWMLFIISWKLFCNTFFSLLYSRVGRSLEKSPRSCRRHSWDRCPSIPPDSIASFLSFIKCQFRLVLSSHSILPSFVHQQTLVPWTK